MAEVFSDSFTDTAGTLLSAHAGWTKHANSAAGTVKISAAGRAYQGTAWNVGTYYANADPADADYDVQADFYMASLASSFYIYGRLTTSGINGYRVQVTATGVTLNKVTNGSATFLGNWTISPTPSIGNTYSVKLEMRGTAIKVYVDGTQRISVTDSVHSAAGKSGLASGAEGSPGDSAYVQLDNFLVTDTSSGSAFNPAWARGANRAIGGGIYVST